MKFFIFIIFIPIVTSMLFTYAGISYFNSETLRMAIAINVPVCLLSASIYTFIK